MRGRRRFRSELLGCRVVGAAGLVFGAAVGHALTGLHVTTDVGDEVVPAAGAHLNALQFGSESLGAEVQIGD